MFRLEIGTRIVSAGSVALGLTIRLFFSYSSKLMLTKSQHFLTLLFTILSPNSFPKTPLSIFLSIYCTSSPFSLPFSPHKKEPLPFFEKAPTLFAVSPRRGAARGGGVSRRSPLRSKIEGSDRSDTPPQHPRRSRSPRNNQQKVKAFPKKTGKALF